MLDCCCMLLHRCTRLRANFRIGWWELMRLIFVLSMLLCGEEKDMLDAGQRLVEMQILDRG